FYNPRIQQGTGDGFQTLFWMILGAGILFVIPLRGLGTISSERVGNNLDLVRLTQLSSTQIVLGKWLAITAQEVLLVTAILPYLVLRYFFGGINIIRDLEIIGWLFAGSMFISAAAIALSTRPLWVRIAIGGLILLITTFGAGFVFRIGSATSTLNRIGGLTVLLVYVVVLLEYSASQIAPIAENHAVRKRSFGLCMAIIWLVAVILMPASFTTPIISLTFPILVIYAVEAMLEHPVHILAQARSFARYGVLGRLAGRVFIPGWATGLTFVLLLTALLIPAWSLTVLSFGSNSDPAVLALGPLFAAWLLFPLPILGFFPRIKQKVAMYSLTHILCLLLFILAFATKPYGQRWEEWSTGWVPLLPFPMASLASMVAGNGNDVFMLPVILSSSGILVLILIILLRPWLQEMKLISNDYRTSQGSETIK
ncbi:MAG: hypothetical protein ABGW78_03835, partial [Pirellulales bacterium]